MNEMDIIGKVTKEVAKIISNPSVQAWITSATWWVAHYLYMVSKWERFRLVMLVINIFLAFWIWTVIYAFVPDTAVKWWIIGMAWFSTYPLLWILEKKWASLVDKYIK